MADLETILGGLKAAADPTRLRLLAVCAQGEWTVSELVQVLGQSQPRISRHLKLLAESGLLERFREGSWVFYRRAQAGAGGRLAQLLSRALPQDDPQLDLDRRRLANVRDERRRGAERYFDGTAAAWDSERDLGVDGATVEAALLRLFASDRPGTLLDVGTGTGRILKVLAPRVGQGLGIDASHDMLKVARASLDRRETRHCQVRHGDMYQLPLADAGFDAVTLHQVLHFADDPLLALSEARRVLRPAGRLVVVDLERHEQEWLREQRRHRRLGFTNEEMAAWFAGMGLQAEPAIRLEGQDLNVILWAGRLAISQDDRVRTERSRAA